MVELRWRCGADGERSERQVELQEVLLLVWFLNGRIHAQGIRLAAGELTLRVAEERRRRAVMLSAVGPVKEARMHGATGAAPLSCCWLAAQYAGVPDNRDATSCSSLSVRFLQHIATGALHPSPMSTSTASQR